MSRFRSLLQVASNATKKAFAWKLESLTPPVEREIFRFQTQDDLKRWSLYADAEHGGLSSASLEVTDNGHKSTGIFSGNLSLDVPPGSKWSLKRGGFCGMRTAKFKGYIDLEPYDTVAFRVRGDGRCYISTIHTENWVNMPGEDEPNTWQAFMFAPKDDWYVVKIPLERYLPTWRGNIIDSDLEMNPARIVGMAISVNAEGGPQGTLRGAGEFRLELDWVKAFRSS
eukprot:TRINITY_DN40537_c0_g1_i1.p1 TRINITY_DN40537_c0_g1~~TRINITY_DN40537_c0_g1_i1.p1  ORF type:complete len:226 (+),score=36.90 TRINITY_DN40537_c0_g1_i1:357-1034(+)